jgi:hypothetical protein
LIEKSSSSEDEEVVDSFAEDEVGLKLKGISTTPRCLDLSFLGGVGEPDLFGLNLSPW